MNDTFFLSLLLKKRPHIYPQSFHYEDKVKIVYAINKHQMALNDIPFPLNETHLIHLFVVVISLFFVVINCTTIAITTRHVVYNVYYTFFFSLRDIIFYIIIVNGKKRNKRIKFFSVSLFLSKQTICEDGNENKQN